MLSFLFGDIYPVLKGFLMCAPFLTVIVLCKVSLHGKVYRTDKIMLFSIFERLRESGCYRERDKDREKADVGWGEVTFSTACMIT